MEWRAESFIWCIYSFYGFSCAITMCASYFFPCRSVTLHTGFSVLVCTNQFFGDPIQCDLVSFDLSMSNINLKTIRHYFHVSWWRTYLFSVKNDTIFYCSNSGFYVLKNEFNVYFFSLKAFCQSFLIIYFRVIHPEGNDYNYSYP